MSCPLCKGDSSVAYACNICDRYISIGNEYYRRYPRYLSVTVDFGHSNCPVEMCTVLSGTFILELSGANNRIFYTDGNFTKFIGDFPNSCENPRIPRPVSFSYSFYPSSRRCNGTTMLGYYSSWNWTFPPYKEFDFSGGPNIFKFELLSAYDFYINQLEEKCQCQVPQTIEVSALV